MRRVALVVSMACNLTLGAADRAVSIEKFTARAGSGATAREIELIHDEMVNLIRNTRKFAVVEREQMKAFLDEQGRVDAGLTDGEGPRSNMLRAAGYLVYGTIQRAEVSHREIALAGGAQVSAEAQVELLLKFSNAESLDVLGTKKAKGKASKILPMALTDVETLKRDLCAQAVGEACRDAVNAFVERAYPTKVLSVNDRFVTVNLTDEQTAIGDEYEIYALGDPLIDEDTGENLGYDEELIGRAVVSRKAGKTSKLEPVSGMSLDRVEKGMVLRKVSREQKAKEVKNKKVSLKDML